MSKEDEAERKTFGGIIPARPKGAGGPTPPPPLDDLLKRRQTMQGPAKLDFLGTHEERMERMEPVPDTASVEFEAFLEIVRLLRKFPKKVRKELIETIADLID